MKNDYKLSFTSASLLQNETIKVAEIFYQKQDWQITKDIILKENVLQRKKEGTIIRELREMKHRLNELTPVQMEFLLKY